MDHKELRRRQAAVAAAKDKRRLAVAVVGLAMCIVLVFMLNKKAQEGGEQGVPTLTSQGTQFTNLLPKLDEAVLAKVKDATDAERVILEPAAFQELSTNARSLMATWLEAFGEPAFDFATGEAESAERRGKIYRLRGELVDTELVTRVSGEDPEYWCTIRTDDGHLFYYASLQVPDTLFGHDNFVRADGYFFKYYRQKSAEDWVTAPLFVGSLLAPSWRRAEPTLEVDMPMLNKLKDMPLGSDAPVGEINQRPEFWHLANVAKSLGEAPEKLEAMREEAIVIDYESLKQLSEYPELFRGRMFKLGGRVVMDPTSVRAGENPLREVKVSSTWIRNEFNGDVLLHLKAPGVYPFDRYARAPAVYHGFFLMLWAYQDRDGNMRRAPVFVVTDSFQEKPITPPFAGQMVLAFMGIAVAIALFLFWLVRRDKRQQAEVREKMLSRKRDRSAS